MNLYQLSDHIRSQINTHHLCVAAFLLLLYWYCIFWKKKKKKENKTNKHDCYFKNSPCEGANTQITNTKSTVGVSRGVHWGGRATAQVLRLRRGGGADFDVSYFLMWSSRTFLDGLCTVYHAPNSALKAPCCASTRMVHVQGGGLLLSGRKANLGQALV